MEGYPLEAKVLRLRLEAVTQRVARLPPVDMLPRVGMLPPVDMLPPVGILRLKRTQPLDAREALRWS